MPKDNTSMFIWIGAAAVAVYGYSQGWFSGLLGTTAASSTTPASGSTVVVSNSPPADTTPAKSAPPVQASAPAKPGYSGPSLSTMFSALLAAEQASYAGDTALQCPDEMTITGYTNTGGGVKIPQFGPRGTSCKNPVASSDVHNWYLTHANVGVPDGLLQAPNQTPIPLTDYWAWAAPILQQHFTGLSGLGDVYAGLAAIARGW